MTIEKKNIEICDVAPRDGLQSQSRMWSPDERIKLINKLSESGVSRIEAVSFVNPKVVPQMANAELIMQEIDRNKNVDYVGLALNLKGVTRALEAGVDEVRFVVVATETFNQKNQGVSIETTMAGYREIANEVIQSKKKLSGVIGAAFGCPFEGNVMPEKILELSKGFFDMGATEISLADTIGAAVPTQVSELIKMVGSKISGEICLGVHLHNTRNTGFANAAAAAMSGVAYMDASVGGIGGCPFAPRATGNIATEDLCFMLRNMGFETGVKLEKLLSVAEWTQDFFETPLPGQVMKAGLFPEVANQKT